MAALPTRTVTVLVTDIEGSAALLTVRSDAWG
jgi:hypothetical protein